MRPTALTTYLASGAVDPELVALLWLLGDGGVPLIVAGPAGPESSAALARALLAIDPARAWLVLDVERQAPTTDRLAALLRGGVAFGLNVDAPDLETVLYRLTRAPHGLPEDAVRRLGVVLILDATGKGVRCTVAHYLRPTERDGQGHVQRRPPAVLAARDERIDALEHYAWGITPELADRVDRAQADFEERQRDRTAFLVTAMQALHPADGWTERVRAYLASEPPPVPAPPHQPAKPSPFKPGLTDPHSH